MRIGDGVEMLEVRAAMFGSPRVIYPTLLLDGDHIILVDTGYPGHLSGVRDAVVRAGVDFERIEQVILTHHDIDHIGGLADLRSQLPRPVMVLAHREEKAYIQGDKTPLKLAQLEANLANLPEESQAFFERLKTAFQGSYSRVDEELTDGQVLPYCGGIQVIHTPGHTLGHICLYIQPIRTLIAGDALTVREGELALPDPAINYDTDVCRQSLRKLAQFDIQAVITYHGGFYRGNVSQRIAEMEEREP